MGEKIKYYLYLALFMPLAWMPLWILYGLSDFLYLIFYHVIHYRIKIVRQNIATSFPSADLSQLRKIERDFYRQFCDNIVETVKLLHISDRQIDRRIKVYGSELVENAAAQKRPIFLYLGHYGNWEWVPAITRHYSQPTISSQIYKPLRDKAFDRVMLKVRSRFNAISIPQDKALRTLIKMSRDYPSYIVGIIDDHRPNHDRSAHYMTFLDHPDTIFNVGGEEIGRRINARYLYLDVEKPRRGHYTLTFKEIAPENHDEDYPYSRQYMNLMEATIRRAPAFWLWSHRRWLYSKK